MKKTALTGSLLLMAFPLLLCQSFDRLEFPFEVFGSELKLPLLGGLNSPQYSAVDLNNDGILDLHIFDRVGHYQMTFLHDGAGGSTDYIYAPEYLEHFPELTHWVLLRDYNNDGIEDLFAYSDVPGVDGIRVHKGFYIGTKIAFERIEFNDLHDLIFFPLATGGRTQLFISKIDYPAVDDMDCDGDLDILTFNLSGGFVELYANQSVERGYGLDSLIFEFADECWGGTFESGVSNVVALAEAPGECAENLTAEDDLELRHAGSTLLTFDGDGDNDKDLMLGDLNFTLLNYLTNGGDCDLAWVTDQDPNFPDYDVMVDIPIFPAGFYLDIDHDGKNDLIASPNDDNSAEDLEVVWFYRNVGDNANPQFEFRQSDLFVSEMIDLGTGANPTFVDYNADDLLDIVVGNFSEFLPGGNKNARLVLFENTGTKHAPRFELADNDYLDMNQYSSTAFNFSPTFGDLDNDGDLDLLVGEEFGKLFYAENTAGPGNPLAFGPFIYNWKDINIGQVSMPFVVDLDRDGLKDIILGEKKGNVNFFKNVGSAGEPEFMADQDMAPNTSFLGLVDSRTPGISDGYSAPWVIDDNGEYLFFTGSEVGWIKMYTDIEDHIYGSFHLEHEKLGGLDDGKRTRPAVADIDQDGYLDILTGNLRGGFSFYRTDILSGFPVDAGSEDPHTHILHVFPNPSKDRIAIELPGNGGELKQLEIFDAAGKLISKEEFLADRKTMTLQGWPAGLYLLKVTLGDEVYMAKLIREN